MARRTRDAPRFLLFHRACQRRRVHTILSILLLLALLAAWDR